MPHIIIARTDMKLSARNQIKGTVTDVKLGATTAHVRVDIGGGQIITAAITNDAANELGLKAGSKATVVIKASDVMIGVD
jgi:molybdopterin-binding protein